MKLIDRILAWIGDSTDSRLERYLAQSTDVAELEHRMKKWEYMGESEKNRWGNG